MNVERKVVITVSDFLPGWKIERTDDDVIIKNGSSGFIVGDLHLDEARNLHEALGVVLNEGQQEEPKRSGGFAPIVFEDGDEEPSGFHTLFDRDGDMWHRDAGKWTFRDFSLSWEDFVAGYGPLSNENLKR